VCFYYDEYADVWREKDVTAAKGHKCYECGGLIAKGERYHYTFSIIRGEKPNSFKECMKCRALRVAIHDIERDHGCSEPESWAPLYGLGEAISEADDHYGFLTDPNDDIDCYCVKREASHLFPRTPVLILEDAVK